MGAWAVAAVGAALTVGLAGCTDPEKDVPKAEVGPVTEYGITLDESATPQQVTYVLLRSLADDVHAAQAHPPRTEDQKKANRITVAVSAPGAIEQRILKALREGAKDPTQVTSLGKERDREIYKIVNGWGSIVAYYVDSFDTDFQAAQARMNVVQGPKTAHVIYEVWHDRARPDVDRQKLDIELAKESAGGKEYWRVARVAFQSPAHRPMTRPATRPAGAPTTQPR